MPKFHAQRSFLAFLFRYFASSQQSNSWSMMLDRSGDRTPPCGTPSLAAKNRPRSTWPALRMRQSRPMNRRSLMRRRTHFSSSRWWTVSKITFDDPAPLRVRAILQLQPHGANRMVNTAFGSETIGTGVEIALPDRLHGHQHRPLDNTIQQDRYTQWSQLAVGLRDIDSLDRCRTISAVQQGRPQPLQMMIQMGFKASLVHSVKARRACTSRCQHDPSRLSKPVPIGDEPEQPIKPTGRIGCGPCRELVLHFTDYQRSSPHWVRSRALQAARTAPLRHVTGFPGPGLLRELCQHGGHQGQLPCHPAHAFPRSYVGLNAYR